MIILSLAMFFAAVVVHEFAHGWCAYKLGDPTAKYAGRLTLNPLAHIDPFGTILLPILLILSLSPVIFGWAKPVPVNFWNLRSPRRDMVLVGLAGPLANLGLAYLFSLGVRSIIVTPQFAQILQSFIIVNLALAVFNLIPIPPLDGSRILFGIMPKGLAYLVTNLEQFGLVILILFLWLGLFDRIVWPVVGILMQLLGV